MSSVFIERKNEAILDVLELENQGYTDIHFKGFHLQGSQELPNHPFFFGELDKEGNIKQEQPSYYFAPKDETLDKGKLTIYLHNL
ncbi:lysozyme, partial [Campylobacter helveticus]